MSLNDPPKHSKSLDQSVVSTSPILIRPATEADISFIFNSWLKSYRGQCKAVTNAVYYKFQHERIEALLKKCNVQVACNTTDHTQIYSYLVSEVVEDVQILHFAYTKHSFRQMGLLGKLFAASSINPASGGFYTHKTDFSSKALKPAWIYNPYLAGG